MLERSGGARTPAFAPGTGVRRRKMTVQWTVIPSNGLATDGEPRAFERRRESGSEERALGEPSEPTDERGHPACEIYMRGAESGVPFLSLPCFGHAKIRRPSYGGETPVVHNRR